MAEGPSRVERVLNLLAILLSTSRPLTRDELVAQVGGYPDDLVAMRRSFERDKELLRAMNVPITMTPLADGVEQGYRVDPDDYYLPELDLTPDEAAALHVAVSAVGLGGATSAGAGAMLKLGNSDAEAAAPIAALPMAPALPLLFDALRRRATLAFPYGGTDRVVEPYGIAAKRGRWYVVGHDRSRDAIRTFRADRIDADLVRAGAGDEYAVPAGFDVDARLDAEPWQFGGDEPVAAQVWCAADVRAGLLDHATRVVEERPDGSAVLEIDVANAEGFRSLVLGFGTGVEVLAPPALRAELTGWVRAMTRRASR